MTAKSIKLNPGDAVLISSATPVDPGYGIPDTPKPPKPPTTPVDPGYGVPEKPVDPGYGIDLGLGWLRPTHPIVLPPPVVPTTPPVDPIYGIDEDIGYVKPEHPIVLPPVPEQPQLKWELKTAWTPVSGWIVVAVPKEGTLVPTPSKKK